MKTEDVTLTARLPGRVVAYEMAEVRPQVAGIISERLFREGARVAAGAPLFRIDAASYQATVAQAEAQVNLAQAELRSLESEADRTRQLVARNEATRNALDQAVAARDSAQASLAAARASRASARIDLERTNIVAPIAGIIGRSVTSRGALVTSGQTTALAVIRRIDPVFVDVTQAAADMLAWRRNRATTSASVPIPVSLFLSDGSEYEERGELTAADPFVNELTGVVTLRLSFKNPQSLLLPGMYVQVEVPQRTIQDAILAPQEGVTRDLRGNPVALVVSAENVVESRKLKLSGEKGPTWIVTDGLTAGDKLIVAGFQKIKAGAKVSPQERERKDASAGGDGKAMPDSDAQKPASDETTSAKN